jgi:hypothetical protein
MATICTHLPTAYDKPKSAGEAYENLTLILCYIEHVFEAINLATEDREDSISHVADIGGSLTKEAYARAEALYEYMKTRQGESKEF